MWRWSFRFLIWSGNTRFRLPFYAFCWCMMGIPLFYFFVTLIFCPFFHSSNRRHQWDSRLNFKLTVWSYRYTIWFFVAPSSSLLYWSVFIRIKFFLSHISIKHLPHFWITNICLAIHYFFFEMKYNTVTVNCLSDNEVLIPWRHIKYILTYFYFQVNSFISVVYRNQKCAQIML